MAKREKIRNKDVRILGDHKKVGKTLVPPMLEYLGEQGIVSWEDRILPELIWMAVFIENLGTKRGVEVCARIAKLANGILSDQYFAFASSFDLLSTEQKKTLVKLINNENCYEEAYKSLSPLLQLYPECPLKFLDNHQENPILTQTVHDFKKTLSKYYNRYAQPAMIIQSNVVYFAAICGKLYYFTDVKVPNLESIISDFESEESKHACASVRATVNGFIGQIHEKVSDHWPRYFWNRGIQIEPATRITRERDDVDANLPNQMNRFIELADLGLEERWNKLPKDIYENYQVEVIGALLARQVTLAKRMARNTAFWDVHIAPILLRVMIDNHITLAWILKEPSERSKHFILHGLGQAKLNVEHLKVENEDGSKPEVQPLVDAWERWINKQRYSFLTSVNLGSWSGVDTRKMAEEADCLDMYRYAYTPFSSCIHNMWDHVGRLNVNQSGNPLHKYMLIPFDPETKPEFGLFLNCAKYLQESFNIVDETFGLQCNSALPYDYWYSLTDEKPPENPFEDSNPSS
jgi:hypothetical protein